VSKVPPGGVGGSYARAKIHYLDDKNREINLALPGGRISGTEYDQYDNVTRSQTAAGRERALAGASGTSTLRTYSSDGKE
jgi:YD repeat-containing protein